ncbi:MAG: YibE/F family protein [Desulfonauticus sp.]|nr:YibE/F family protein [Desulfonauticus sp.]
MPKKDKYVALFFAILCVVLYFWPNKYEIRATSQKAIRCKGEVLKVDNSDIHQKGIIKIGTQEVVLKILNGPYKGKIFKATNQLMGYVDRDKIFQPGDLALVVISLNHNNEIVYINPQDIYRIDLELYLFLAFALSVVLFGGWVGVKALLSFVFSALVLGKILIPYILDGVNPILLSLGVVIILTTSIVFLVAGPTRKGLAAFLGSLLGIATTCVLALWITHKAKIHGAVMPFSEPLLYAGFAHLRLTEIFIGTIFLAASGAVMDIAMDIAASMEEIFCKKPEIRYWQLALSGLRVGRAVFGTMVTTLLLAYCGGYLTMLMFFMAQGVPVFNMLNLVYVSAEIIKTIAGSFGLVLTAPFTALIGAWIIIKNRELAK